MTLNTAYSKTRPVLFCDGPRKGAWREIETEARLVATPMPAGMGFEAATADADKAAVTIDAVEYTIYEVAMTSLVVGCTIHVATCQKGATAGEAILRAILQPDVAQKLLGDASGPPKPD